MLGLFWLALVPWLLVAGWLALTRGHDGAFDGLALALAAVAGLGGLVLLRPRLGPAVTVALLYLAAMALLLPPFGLLFVCGAFGDCI
ncbi:MAG TPA: hypothetical protein VF693_07325 [Allosphingosinicella sp.]|jgi:hypothetical protein